jgi:hypothetical protein
MTEALIEAAHTSVAMIIAITSLITAFTILLRKIKEFLKGCKELVDLIKVIKEGGKLKMTKHIKTSIKIFLISFICLFIGLGILLTKGITQPALRTPFDVTLYFRPSGWMGDGEKGTRYVQLNTGFTNCNRSDDTDGICIQINYQPDPHGKGWAGIYWQYPDGNWGDQPGRRIAGAQRIVFWAKGERGGEIVEFKAGGINDPNKPYQDSFEVARRIRLNREWSRYEIPLSGQDLSHVIGAFAWVASRDANPGGVTFYLDDIRYE